MKTHSKFRNCKRVQTPKYTQCHAYNSLLRRVVNTYIPHITCMQEARCFMSILPTVTVDDAYPTLSVKNEDIIPTVTLQV